jgi:hypothetical protein
MAFNVCERPANSALAIKNPRGGLHGHDEHIRESTRYWSDVLQTAEAEVDIARYSLANILHSEFTNMGWLLDTAVIVADRYGLRYMETNAERDRKRLLGSLALSDLSRALFGKGGNGVVKEIADGVGSRAANLIFDAAGVNGHPLPPRIHVVEEDAVALLGEGAPNTWYVDDTTGLYVRRAAFDLSKPAALSMKVDSVSLVEQTPMVSLFPYVPSKTPS